MPATDLTYAFHSGSSPHFFSALRSNGGTPVICDSRRQIDVGGFLFEKAALRSEGSGR